MASWTYTANSKWMSEWRFMLFPNILHTVISVFKNSRYSKTSLARTHITQTLDLRGWIFLAGWKVLGFIQRCRRITRTWLAWRDERLGWPWVAGWLYTEINVRHRELNPDAVAHLSTNFARRRLTLLIEANVLTTSQTTNRSVALQLQGTCFSASGIGWVWQ